MPRTNPSKTALSHPLFVMPTSVCADMLSHPHYPLPRTKLASLVKGEVLSPDKIRATTGGIATPPSLALHQPLQNRTIPLTFRNANICMCRYAFTSALSLASHHHTCLPCQREVDWRQGTNLNIIAFTCDMLTIFILQTFLPSRRRDCHTYSTLSVSLTPPLTIPQSQ